MRRIGDIDDRYVVGSVAAMLGGAFGVHIGEGAFRMGHDAMHTELGAKWRAERQLTNSSRCRDIAEVEHDYAL
jgi:hypothetical protein